MSGARGWAQTGHVRGEGWAIPFAFLVVGLLVLLLRWTFARGSSVVAAPPRPGEPDDYGLLVPVAAPRSATEVDVVRRRLAAAGIRSTAATTRQGRRVFVHPEDEGRARAALVA